MSLVLKEVVAAYRSLEAGKPLGLPPAGLQDTATDASLQPIPSLVEGYVVAIRQAQPGGPYWLAGYSLGGTLAWEAAHQLEVAGDRVGAVILLDAGFEPRIDGYHLTQESVEAELERLVHRRIRRELDAEVAAKIGNLPLREQFDFFFERDKQNGQAPEDVTASQYN
jgi:thioesterase domain-containing protein